MNRAHLQKPGGRSERNDLSQLNSTPLPHQNETPHRPLSLKTRLGLILLEVPESTFRMIDHLIKTKNAPDTHRFPLPILGFNENSWVLPPVVIDCISASDVKFCAARVNYS